MIKRLLFSFFLCINIFCSAQDIHFSDFYSSPLNLNPAMAGEFDGNYRYIGNYRWQYGTVTIPYQTFSISADVKNDASRKKALPIGFGMLINYDFTGDSRYTSYQFGIPISYHFMGQSKTWRISFGVLPQIIFNQIDFSRLEFPDQFINDMFYQNVKTKENATDQSIRYFNLTSGLNATFITSKKSALNIGFTGSNLTRPSLSFYNDNSSRLNRRYAAMTKFRYRIVPTIDLVPSAIFQFQGKLREFQFGTKAMYYIDNLTIPMVNCGAWFRSRDRDAIILNLGFLMNGYLVGFNYDINISKLKTASNGIGAFEISIQYIFNRSLMPHKFEAMKCPTHL